MKRLQLSSELKNELKAGAVSGMQCAGDALQRKQRRGIERPQGESKIMGIKELQLPAL